LLCVQWLNLFLLQNQEKVTQPACSLCNVTSVTPLPDVSESSQNNLEISPDITDKKSVIVVVIVG
jgi:hypothetical protein